MSAIWAFRCFIYLIAAQTVAKFLYAAAQPASADRAAWLISESACLLSESELSTRLSLA